MGRAVPAAPSRRAGDTPAAPRRRRPPAYACRERPALSTAPAPAPVAAPADARGARAPISTALRAVILRRREEIIDRIQQDTGKSRSDALISEIFGVLDNLAWMEKAAPKALEDHKVHTPIALMGKTS